MYTIHDEAGNLKYCVGDNQFFTRSAAEHLLWLRAQLRREKDAR